MDCNRTDCIHYKVCEEWKSLGNDNYINDSYGNCDNYSPTVEHSLLPLESDLDSAYMQGYEAGKAEGILKGTLKGTLKANTRPKGRWEFYEESSDDNGMAYYKCSECGRLIHAEESGLLKNYPYCHCGADMRGGK